MDLHAPPRHLDYLLIHDTRMTCCLPDPRHKHSRHRELFIACESPRSRLGLVRRVGQALATEAIAECIGSGSVGEAESNIDLLDLVSIQAATDWDAVFAVKYINL